MLVSLGMIGIDTVDGLSRQEKKIIVIVSKIRKVFFTHIICVYGEQ